MKRYRKASMPVFQVEQSDCGVACLSAIIRHYDGFEHFEKLREWSGTTQQGTTLLGLYQAAQKSNLCAEGKQANIEYLRNLSRPAILHVVMDDLQHYVVSFGHRNGRFHIGDPSRGMLMLKEKDLEAVWRSNTLLELSPDRSFRTRKSNDA